MRQVRSLFSTVVLAGTLAIPVSGSPLGDATYSLATYRAMAEPTASPSDRIMALYMASAERLAMLERLREKYPALVR